MPKLDNGENRHSVVELRVSNRTMLKIALFVVGVLIVVWAADVARHSLLLIFISFFLALALNAPVHFISRHLPWKLKGRRGFGTAISYLIVIIILGGFIAYLAPPLARQTNDFVKAAPRLVSEFRDQSGSVGKFIRRYHLGKEVTTLSNQLSAKLHNAGGKVFSTLVGIGKSIFDVLIVIVLTFMMLVEGPRWVSAANRLVPERHHQLADRLAGDMYRVIKGFVNGRVIMGLIAMAFLAPALYILHIGYPVALLVVIFICALIPLIGHPIAAVIVTIVALFHSVTSGVVIFVYYILYIQFENYIIQPKLQANATKMSPLLVFAALIIGINFGGIFGGIIAIPLAGCLRIAVLEFLRTRKLISTPQFEKAVKRDHSSATEDH